jgi:hypothetical protein
MFAEDKLPPSGIRLLVKVAGSATAALIEAARLAISGSVSKAVGLPAHVPVELWQERQLPWMIVLTLGKYAPVSVVGVVVESLFFLQELLVKANTMATTGMRFTSLFMV